MSEVELKMAEAMQRLALVVRTIDKDLKIVEALLTDLEKQVEEHKKRWLE